MSPVQKIVVCGNGLAAMMCVTALSHHSPEDIEIIHVKPPEPHSKDIFFGSVTSQSAYDFLLNIGVSEPELLLETGTAFSLGTHYVNWGPEQRNWTQSFHMPLPLFDGIGFHHFLKRRQKSEGEGVRLEDYIMSIQAAKKNVFAHPPEGKNIPLASVEYGYHFLPTDWRNFFAARLKRTRVITVESGIKDIVTEHAAIKSLVLNDGRKIDADFFIDCTEAGSLISRTSEEVLKIGKQFGAFASLDPAQKHDAVCRTLKGQGFGWESVTPLQSGAYKLTLFSSESRDEARLSHNMDDISEASMTLYQRKKPWFGNCLAMGHAAACVDPLTAAPLMMLQNDIERLLEFLPVTGNMTVEQREYNRRFDDNYDHAALFHQAFFKTQTQGQSSYWQGESSRANDSKLETKLTQFESRGLLVQYDHEPFKAEDWTMMHFGMGRTPKRYDPLVDKTPEDQIEHKLENMKKAIAMMAEKMPPKHIYMSGLLKYLKEKHDAS